MNKILYIVALSALWVGCQNTAPAGNASTSGDTSDKITIGDHYIIDGTAPVKEGAHIFLYQYKDRVYTPVDSVALDSQGHFHFEGKTTEPLVYALRLNGSGKRAHLYIENSPISLILNPDWNFEFLRSSDGTQVFELYNRMALNNALDLLKRSRRLLPLRSWLTSWHVMPTAMTSPPYPPYVRAWTNPWTTIPISKN